MEDYFVVPSYDRIGYNVEIVFEYLSFSDLLEIIILCGGTGIREFLIKRINRGCSMNIPREWSWRFSLWG